MTTSPVATRPPANARFLTEDAAGPQQTLGPLRAGWPVEVSQTGPGTASDVFTWDEQAALVLDIALSVTNGSSTLDGGTVTVEVNASGQSAYGASDGWVAVVPTIGWLAGAAPFFLSGLLGKAYVLTKAGQSGARIRIVVTNAGLDEVVATALVAPVVANPSCAP